MQVYIERFEQLFADHTIFTGVTYTDAHVTLPGLARGLRGARSRRSDRSLQRREGATHALACRMRSCRRWSAISRVQGLGWYVSSFIVKPNELVREQPYIAHNIDLTRRAYGLDRIAQREFPAETTVEATDAANNQPTLQNIRLWDWRALQDTLRQIQEIRTYYDFPDIDIDRYEIDGTIRQVMLATRELSIDKLPESSRNWINEKLIYTHGYGITMNPVNGFTPEGLPTLILRDMPVQSTVKGLTVTRPEIYFGELTNTDVYVKTRQKEFNYPQGQTNSLTSYEGKGGIVIGGFLRRLIIALDRGDLAKLPFSDDVNSESRLLMRRSVRARVRALAPFLTFDRDPYIVVGDDGRLQWIMDAFTTSDSYPYSRHYRLGGNAINYVRNSVKVVIDAYDGTTTFYVFDTDDPIIAAYRGIFPSLFKDASAMSPAMRKHVRYPELLLNLQASVYSLYHMTNPEVFYNREDLWTLATEASTDQGGKQTTQPMEPNFVLMKLPGETGVEFVDILPFTPANRNNLIGWIAGRSDGANYGTAMVYNFPKTQAHRRPLAGRGADRSERAALGTVDAVESAGLARAARHPAGDSDRAGIVVCGADLPPGGAEPHAGAASRRARPAGSTRLWTDVRVGDDRTFRRRGLVNERHGCPPEPAPRRRLPLRTQPATDLKGLIAAAAKDFSDYERLTAAGKLGEAGQKLEELKRKIEELNSRQK